MVLNVGAAHCGPQILENKLKSNEHSLFEVTKSSFKNEHISFPDSKNFFRSKISSGQQKKR